jgi:hypothetical protein
MKTSHGGFVVRRIGITLSDREKVPVIILDEERHFRDIEEVASVKISDLQI